jgi:hypothetical protein
MEYREFVDAYREREAKREKKFFLEEGSGATRLDGKEWFDAVQKAQEEHKGMFFMKRRHSLSDTLEYKLQAYWRAITELESGKSVGVITQNIDQYKKEFLRFTGKECAVKKDGTVFLITLKK